jgi:ACS family hexuronate transporter-like MFS transporter
MSAAAAKPVSAAEVPAAKGDKRRWLILALLLGITTINFIDRQTLSVLAPQIRETLHLSRTVYGRIASAFQFGMMSGEFPMAWIMDRWGVRLGMAGAVIWWSIATGLHGFAKSGFSLGALRYWMGTGECGNYSGGVKTVGAWFPPAERAFAIGFFNSGSMIGAIVAPPLVVYLAAKVGYRWAFLVPALLALFWVPLWLKYCRGHAAGAKDFPPSLDLLQHRQTWAIMGCRFLVGPVAQFYWYWIFDYLVTIRGFSMKQVALVGGIPFIAGGVGSLAGGLAAGWLLKRDVSVPGARQLTMYLGAILCLASFGVYYAPSAGLCLVMIAVALFGHTFLSANMFAVVPDMFPDPSVGRVTGLHGICGGLSGVLFPLLTGILADKVSYAPVFALAAVMPMAGVILLFFVSQRLKPVVLQ